MHKIGGELHISHVINSSIDNIQNRQSPPVPVDLFVIQEGVVLASQSTFTIRTNYIEKM